MGQSPYAASKISADQLAISYWRSFNLPVKIIRPFNTYGPRQSARAVISSIIMQALNNKDIKLGNIQSSRDYTYVTDLCDAYFDVLKIKNLFGTPINIGSNNENKIKDIAKMIIKKINPLLNIKVEKSRFRPKFSEVDRLKCDNSLIIKKTKWRPKVNFNNGLDKTIDWIKKSNLSTTLDNYRI